MTALGGPHPDWQALMDASDADEALDELQARLDRENDRAPAPPAGRYQVMTALDGVLVCSHRTGDLADAYRLAVSWRGEVHDRNGRRVYPPPRDAILAVLRAGSRAMSSQDVTRQLAVLDYQWPNREHPEPTYERVHSTLRAMQRAAVVRQVVLPGRDIHWRLP